MKSRISWMIVTVLALFFAGLPAEGAEQTIDSLRREAYAQLRKADTARDRREWSDAAYLYHDARLRYRAIKAEHPDWDPEYLDFRIHYCDRELNAIGHLSGRMASEWLADRFPPEAGDENEGTAQLRALYQAALERIRYLEHRVEELEDELEVFLEMEEIEAERDRQSFSGEGVPPPPSAEDPITPPRSSRPQAIEIPEALPPEPGESPKKDRKSWLPWR